ncbi:fluoride efflux transporter FluC [Blastococcus atacamensis]|uniref:fluoride efflux transporter FluC n=1 Tax=Blastococcus atacamensis TaxID=2070508 RepID=UPI000CEC00C0|nr:CrcB family protein [Blastococcus atacamensis]
MTPWLVVAGAMLGAPLRLLAERIAVARSGPGSVLGTLVVNVTGSAVLGVLVGWAAAPGWLAALLGTGFCGALTTFSTFGTDVVRLAEQRRWPVVLGYVGATLALGLGAAVAGHALGRAF